MEENYLPQKWRNKVFRFQAGGYDGCICHPAALIVDRDGEVHLVGSDGGAGGLDEDDWYCRKCRAYLDEKGVNGEGEFLYGPKKNDEFYKEFRRLREGYADERRRRERKRVLQALEGEVGKEPEEIPGWDHEFELIGDIDTEDKVREVCRRIESFFYDVYFRAGIADALVNAEYPSRVRVLDVRKVRRGFGLRQLHMPHRPKRLPRHRRSRSRTHVNSLPRVPAGPGVSAVLRIVASPLVGGRRGVRPHELP